MAFTAMFILYAMIAFSFAVTSIFMFVPKKNETVHIIFFWLAVALSVFVTFIDATALPSNYVTEIVFAWAGLLFSAVGVVVRLAVGKTNTIANLLVMISTLYGIAGYFLFG